MLMGGFIMDNKYSAAIVGTGIYVPENVLTNQQIEKMTNTSDKWIIEKFGIKERHIASKDQATSDLSIPAVFSAIKDAGMKPEEIELIILATSIPDIKTPATAAIIQGKIGASKAAVFDLNNACSGFITALITASKFIADGTYQNSLIIGTCLYSREISKEDRNKLALFGDGSGAVVLKKCSNEEGLISSNLGNDGTGSHILNVPYGESRYPANPETIDNKLIRYGKPMEGKEIFDFAVDIIPKTINNALNKINLQPSDLDFIILHQANINIIKTGLNKTGIGMKKTFTNIDKYGNTSEASIPIALHEALLSNKIKKGDMVALSSFGMGLSWGTAIFKWI